jgi:hypothetical protein
LKAKKLVLGSSQQIHQFVRKYRFDKYTVANLSSAGDCMSGGGQKDTTGDGESHTQYQKVVLEDAGICLVLARRTAGAAVRVTLLAEADVFA